VVTSVIRAFKFNTLSAWARLYFNFQIWSLFSKLHWIHFEPRKLKWKVIIKSDSTYSCMKFSNSLQFLTYFSSWPFICNMFLYLYRSSWTYSIQECAATCGLDHIACLSQCHAVKFFLVVCWHKAFYGIWILYTRVKGRHKIDLHVLTGTLLGTYSLYSLFGTYSLYSRRTKHYGLPVLANNSWFSL
jgi:hypothetical protein